MRRMLALTGAAIIAVIGGGCSSTGSPDAASTSGSSGATSSPSASPSTATADRASWVCPDPIDTALPVWARDGFKHPTAQQPHLVGTRQAIAAVPFGWPLLDHRSAGHANKILWIAKTGTGPLHIVATEKATGQTATRNLPDGPGPSIVDMPAAGCWRFALSWANQHDELFIRYYNQARATATD